MNSQNELIPSEIFETPQAILQTLIETRRQAKDAAALMKEQKPRRIFLIGNGTSFYSSLAASYTGRSLASSPSAPYVLAIPCGDFRHYMPQIEPQDVIVGMSASGKFRDVIAVFEQLEKKCLRIGITHIADSPLTQVADAALVSSGGPTNVPVMTKTYASTLTAAHLLLLEYFAAPDAIYKNLEDSARLCETALQDIEARIAPIVSALQTYQHAFYFGAGIGYAASLEGALKMKEMAMLHAEGSEVWEYASGPATIVDEKFFCTAFYTDRPTDQDIANSANLSRQWGARVIEIGPHSHVHDFHLPVSANPFDPFNSLSLVPPAALLAYRMARARGYDPNFPAWRERYYAQGMHHLIGKDK
jgi:glucosamine--fructose-6-phosphate aminotransferase (isomerizing)